VTLSPDLKPEILGYQGAMAFVGPRDKVFGEPNLLSVAFVEDGAEGLEVDLSSLVQATTLTDGVATPAWSHDGLEIAFLYYNTTYPDAGNSLEVIPVEMRGMEIILHEDEVRMVYDSSLVDVYGSDHSVVHRPSWSPDDSWIGFCATVGIEPGGGRSYDLFVATSDGSCAVNVTNGSMRPKYMDWNPTWMPDGN
jgi:Tol biopolymer transport system component